MSRLKKIIKKNYKIALGIVIGFIIAPGSVYVLANSAYSSTEVKNSSSNISYNNQNSKLTATNLQDAIDELNTKSDIRKSGKFVSAYTYSTSTSTKCITGEESTCVKSECYKNKSAGSCKAGDIIKYKVNDTNIIAFHVMFDEGATMTMQSQKNVVYGYSWYGTSKSENDATKGPLLILPALEQATKGWTNVNNQTYTAGTTVFKTNAYTGCPASSGSKPTCSTNTYTLPSRTARARMITVQEATSFGCYFKKEKTCPIWLTNYLSRSTSYGGTANDSAADDAYWTMSTNSDSIAYDIGVWGDIDYNYTWGWDGAAAHGARAVVVVSK